MSSIYESTTLVEQYLLFHYGEPDEVMPYPFGPGEALNFPVKIVARYVTTGPMPADSRALDLGCAVGRSSFELSKYFGAVIGIDKSSAFIAAAESVRRDGGIDYKRLDEAPNFTRLRAHRPNGSVPGRIKFETGDALELRSGLGKFDFVLAANLIDRVPDPASLLKNFAALVAPGGRLVLTSPYTWLEDFTPSKNWLSNYGAERTESLAAIRVMLNPDFEFQYCEDLPFLIREHARKFQWSAAQVSVWKRAD